MLLDDRTPKYIDKISQTFDETYLLHEHGSGDYYFSLNDTDIRGTNRTVVCVPKSRPLSLRDPEYPPKRHLEHIAWSDPANKQLKDKLIREGKMTPQGEIVQPPAAGTDPSITVLAKTISDGFNFLLRERQQPASGAGAESKAFERVTEMMGKASDKAIEIALSQVKQNDPEQFMKILGAVKELMPKPTHDNSLGMVKEMLSLFRELAPAQQAQQQNPISQMKEMFGMMREMREAMGLPGVEETGGGTRGGGKWGWVQDLVPMIPGVLSGGAQLIAAARQAHTVTPGAAIPMPAPGPGGTGPHAVDAPPAITSGNPADPAAAAAVDPAIEQLAQFMPIIGQPLMKYINDRRNGADFADWLSDSYGEFAYAQVKKLSKEQILQALGMFPPMRQFLEAMPEQVSQFIDEFLHPELVPVEEEPAGAVQ